MSLDQAFFAAYQGTPNETPMQGSTTRTESATRSQTQRRSSAAGAPQYRVDAPRASAVPAPHRPSTSRSSHPAIFETQAIQIGSFGWDPSMAYGTVVVTSPSPAVPPKAPSPDASARSLSSPGLRETLETLQRERPAVPVSSSEQVQANQDQAPSEASREDLLNWTPIWEIDEFEWPAEAVRLQAEQTDYFRYAGEKLRDASYEGLKVMAVTATREKEGCTTLAICLARSAAAAGAKVALLDANLAAPQLSDRLGLDFSRGWQDVLNERCHLPEAAVCSLQDDLTLFPLSPGHAVETLNDARFSQLIHSLTQYFDLVIVDAGAIPVQGAPFEGGENLPVNAAMIVRDLRRTSESETLLTASRLRALGIEAIGIAENFVPTKASRSAAA